MEATQGLNSLSLSDPQLSLMVKMIPSPDWFVGVDGVDLCQGDQWKEEATFDLQPYDAGTDSGFTFSSPNFPTSPVEKVTKVGFCEYKAPRGGSSDIRTSVVVVGDGLRLNLTASSTPRSVRLGCLRFV